MHTVTERMIDNLEKRLGVKFPAIYRQFLIERGMAVIAGYTILGIPEEVKKPVKVEPSEEALDLAKIVENTSCPVCGQRKYAGKITCYPCYKQYLNDAGDQMRLSVWIKEKLSLKRKEEESKKEPRTNMSVLEAFYFLIEKRPELAQKKLIPICFKINLNTDKLMVLCMDLSENPEDDAPLVAMTDIEQAELVPHTPKFFGEWIENLENQKNLTGKFKNARQRIRNRKNEIRKKELLTAVKQRFGQQCPLCRTNERDNFLTCQACHEEWRQREGKKSDFVEWVQGKLEAKKMSLPKFSHKGGKDIKHVHVRPQDWHARIFRVTDYVVGLTAFRYNHLLSCLEVDAFWSEDMVGYVKGQAIRNLAIAIFSEANALTGSLNLTFTEDVRENPRTGKINRGLEKALEKLPGKKKVRS